jgi:hypothetical protein
MRAEVLGRGDIGSIANASQASGGGENAALHRSCLEEVTGKPRL